MPCQFGLSQVDKTVSVIRAAKTCMEVQVDSIQYVLPPQGVLLRE
jgi:hypothetical protein